MNEEIKISVIVPVYNLEKELSRCLNSVLNQTYYNIEVIVVDDGSQDESRKVIEDFSKKDPRIVPFYKENGGVTSARMTGIKEATGSYIGFVDGDDEIEKDMYEFLINNALKYQADISHCGYQMCFPDGRINYFHNTGNVLQHNSEKAIKELLDGTIIEPGLCNKLFHRSLFEQFFTECKIDSSIKINEDLLMNYYLFKKADKLIFEDRCKYHYLVRRTSASRQKFNEHKIFDPIKVKKIILEHCDDEIKTAAQRAYVNTCVYTYCGLSADDKKEYRNEMQKIRNEIKENYGWCDLLVKRTKILAFLIVKMPMIFSLIYPIYVSKFQKSKYS